MHVERRIHGGSFYYGAATFSGLDGSALALSTRSIVVTLQYRLGVLGFLPPSSLDSSVNLGVRDVTTALAFLHTILPSFNGDPNSITVGGQSSGATMIRGGYQCSFLLGQFISQKGIAIALMAAPIASELFKNAILQSDPMFYSFLPNSAYNTVQSWYYSNLPCSASSCSVSQLLSTQNGIINNASQIAPAAGPSEPMRPSVDGQFITTSLSDNSYPSSLKPILITTVADEAGLIVGGHVPLGFPPQDYGASVQATFGTRTTAIIDSPWYKVSSMEVEAGQPNDQTREALSLLGTDGMWRCPSWSFARSYAAKGGSVHVGLFRVGASYAGNDASDFCMVDGRVCHQDDIYITVSLL